MTPQVFTKKLWETCDTCGVQVLAKDFTLHLRTSCPPAHHSWTHGFIHKSVLHGWLAETADYEDQLDKYLHRVYLSAEVLQKCEIHVDDPLVVTVSNIACVKRACIALKSNINLTAVIMPKKVLELVWNTTKGDATVRKLLSHPIPAEKIHVSLDIKKEELSSQDNIITHLHKLYSGQIIFRGQKLFLPYFGKDLLIHVDNVISLAFEGNGIGDNRDFSRELRQNPELKSTDDEMAHALSRLVIDAQHNETSPFYRVVPNTQWVMSSTPQQSTTTDLNKLGGLTDTTERLKRLISKALSKKSQGPVFRGILLYGPPGTGKTSLIRALAQEFKADFHELKIDELYSKILGETESRLRSFFARVKSSSFAIVLLDRIHSFCPKKSSTTDATDLERRILYILNTSLDELNRSNVNFVVLATTYDPDNLAPSIKRLGRLELELEIPVPSSEARFDILTKLLHGTKHELTKDEIWSISRSAHAFVGADMLSLVSSARAIALEMGQQVLTSDHMQLACKKIHPSAMREVLVKVPNVRWSDIGGQEDLKLKLRQVVEWPMTHPESFARLSIRQPRGILMFGPPGCSKTMIAKALASESKLNFLSIKGPELFNKWLGESERAVRSVFRRARQVAPAIIFFDEIDALGGKRTSDNGSSSNVEDRVLSQLLVEMNGLELLDNVFIIAATNRPDLLDKALLRPSRLDHKVYVPLPDAETRRQIFTMQLKKMPAEAVDINELVEATAGFSGAEVVAVCHEAALIAMSTNMDCNMVGPQHFKSALSIVLPRTSPDILKIFESFV